MEDNKQTIEKSKGVLVAGYIVLLIGILEVVQDLYAVGNVFFLQSGGALTSPLWLFNIESLIIGGIGIIISSLAIIRRQKWGIYVLATITLSAIVSMSVNIIHNLLYLFSSMNIFSGALLYNGAQFLILIYLWKNRRGFA